MNNVTRSLAIALVLSASGCAYQPKQVEASRPLVSPLEMNSQPVLPEHVQQALNISSQGATFIYQNTSFTVGQRYVSALGRDCVELTYHRQSGQLQRSVACKSAEQWYQVPQLEQAALGNLFAQ